MNYWSSNDYQSQDFACSENLRSYKLELVSERADVSVDSDDDDDDDDGGIRRKIFLFLASILIWTSSDFSSRRILPRRVSGPFWLCGDNPIKMQGQENFFQVLW